MDRTEMHKEFKLLMDKAGEGGSPSFLSSEIDRFLNIAQDKFVSKRAFGNNVRRTSFEEDQKRRDDLRMLIAEHSEEIILNNSNDEKPNSYFFVLPDNYRHSINEEALIYSTDSPTSLRRVPAKPITYDRYNKIMDDPFNKPTKDTVYRLDFGEYNSSETDSANYKGSFELITGEKQSISKYYLRYLKNPSEISKDQDCILSAHTHREIVRMAVVDALENVEQPRYQSSKIELNEIE
jgi:hypothetical protein